MSSNDWGTEVGVDTTWDARHICSSKLKGGCRYQLTNLSMFRGGNWKSYRFIRAISVKCTIGKTRTSSMKEPAGRIVSTKFNHQCLCKNSKDRIIVIVSCTELEMVSHPGAKVRARSTSSFNHILNQLRLVDRLVG